MYLLLFIIWIMFNGAITLEIVLFGLAISALILFFMCKFLNHSIKKELLLYKLAPQIIAYMLVLIKEVVFANLSTARLLLTPKLESQPQVFSFTSDLKSDFCKTMLANSITLTPGTITVDVIDNQYKIHCLDPDLAEGIEESVFVIRLRKIDEIIMNFK